MVDEGTNYICITRPRRFGKTVMANMIASFFSKAQDAADIFDCLKISQDADYQIYRNKYNVIHISFNDISRQCTSYEQYIARIEERLIKDLQKEFPDAKLAQEQSAVDALTISIQMIVPYVLFLYWWNGILFSISLLSQKKKKWHICHS